MDDKEIVREFLIETAEGLARLDNELLELEKRPQDAALLASIFRAVHTMKGTCGFLGFPKLESLTHEGETLLSQLRSGHQTADPSLVSVLLKVVDAARLFLAQIESTGQEGDLDFAQLIEELRQATSPTLSTSVGASTLVGESLDPVAAPSPPLASTFESSLPAPPKPQLPFHSPSDPPKEPLALSQLSSQPPSSASPLADAPANQEAHLQSSDSTIRVDVGLLDRLMNLVGELVLARNQILQHHAARESGDGNSGENSGEVNTTAQRLNLITSELQEAVMKTRMQPIGLLWNKLPRMVREIAHALDKQIHLEMEGADTELDKTILEAIRDPLTHLVRNCCDHGIESPAQRIAAGKPALGRLTLRAFHEGGQVNVEICDDGAGIDPLRIRRKAVDKGLLRQEQAERLSDRDSLQLIFAPGFSTAEKITNVSGRGVGMDVVKSNIEKIGGVVDLSSEPGRGTTVRLRIPLTLAIIPGLIVQSGGERFVIPQASLLELIRLEGNSDVELGSDGDHALTNDHSLANDKIESLHGDLVYRRRGELLPVLRLNEELGLPNEGDPEVVNMIVLQSEDRHFGLIVDSIRDTQEIVVKPLGKQFKGLSVYAGATIMGDGRVALILDVSGLGKRAHVLGAQTAEISETQDSGAAAASRLPGTPAAAADLDRLLLFAAGACPRLAVPLSLVARLEEFSPTQVEASGGRQVVQYRGRILPLFSLASLLEAGPHAPVGDTLPVLVFQQGERRLGLIVDRILDIVEGSVEVREPSRLPHRLGSLVVGDRVTDLVDLHSVLRTLDPDWFQSNHGPTPAELVLLESSPFSRALLKNGFAMHGLPVWEASSVEAALAALDACQHPLLVTSLSENPLAAHSTLARLRRESNSAHWPALGLTAPGRPAQLPPDASLPAFDDYQEQFSWPAMLASIDRLSRQLPHTPARNDHSGVLA